MADNPIGKLIGDETCDAQSDAGVAFLSGLPADYMQLPLEQQKIITSAFTKLVAEIAGFKIAKHALVWEAIIFDPTTTDSTVDPPRVGLDRPMPSVAQQLDPISGLHVAFWGKSGPATTDWITFSDGSNWLTGDGVPSGMLGSVGDFYLDLGTTDPGDRVAPTAWYEGTGVPAGTLGVRDDFYLDMSNGDVYQKGPSTWGSPVGNIQGPAGMSGSGGADEAFTAVSISSGGISGFATARKLKVSGTGPLIGVEVPSSVHDGTDISLTFTADMAVTSLGTTSLAPIKGAFVGGSYPSWEVPAGEEIHLRAFLTGTGSPYWKYIGGSAG